MSLRYSQLLQYAAAQGSDSGIMLAGRYLSEVSGCFDGGFCPAKAFGENAPQWEKEVGDAATRLVYADLNAAEPESLTKGISESELPDGIVLAFDGRMTSRRKDHDGDIVEPMGLEFPNAVPLLWQHVRFQPIGAVKSLKSQSEDGVFATSHIADTELGRDAATLAKCGALRLSIGFKPLTFDPLGKTKGIDGKERVTGWHVKSARLMELSLVTLPSNEDAVITAFASKSLKSDLANHWAKAFYDLRPAVGKGFGPGEFKIDGLIAEGVATTCGCGTHKSHDAELIEKAAAGGKPTQAEADDVSDADAAKLEKLAGYIMTLLALRKGGAKKDAPAFVAKSFDGDAVEKAFGVDEYGYPGSFEWLSSQLSRSLDKFLRASGEDLDDCYAHVWATFAAEAFVVCRRYGKAKSKVLRIAYELDADGQPKWTGDPREIDIKPTIVEKLAAAPLWDKSNHSGVADAEAESQSIDLRSVDPDELATNLIARAFTCDKSHAAVRKIASISETLGPSSVLSLLE